MAELQATSSCLLAVTTVAAFVALAIVAVPTCIGFAFLNIGKGLFELIRELSGSHAHITPATERERHWAPTEAHNSSRIKQPRPRSPRHGAWADDCGSPGLRDT
jgi:hypothetical protein